MPMQLHSNDPPRTKPLSAHDAFRAVKAAATGVARGEEAVVENIPAAFALQVILSVEADPAFGDRSLRASYNSLTGQMFLKPNPDKINGSCQAWLQREQKEMGRSGWLNTEEDNLLEIGAGTTIHAFNPPYEGSVKEHDVCWEIAGESAPSLIVEVGCLQTYSDRLRGMDVWKRAVTPPSAAILIIFGSVGGDMRSFVEVFRRAPVNGYAEEPRRDIFPEPDPPHAQYIAITRGELFGSRLVPGRNAGDVWNLDLARLRRIVQIRFNVEGRHVSV